MMMVDEIRPTPARWGRLLTESAAAEYLAIGRTFLRDKGPKPKSIGRRVVYDIRDLDRWADRLNDQPLDTKEHQDEAAEVERRILERLNGHG